MEIEENWAILIRENYRPDINSMVQAITPTICKL
jgi:hypothetical protein